MTSFSHNSLLHFSPADGAIGRHIEFFFLACAHASQDLYHLGNHITRLLYYHCVSNSKVKTFYLVNVVQCGFRHLRTRHQCLFEKRERSEHSGAADINQDVFHYCGRPLSWILERRHIARSLAADPQDFLEFQVVNRNYDTIGTETKTGANFFKFFDKKDYFREITR